MSKKKSIITSIACLMLLPNISSSEIINSHVKAHTGLYISGQYKLGISRFSQFSVKNAYGNTAGVIGLKHNAISIKRLNNEKNFNIPYKATFQNNLVSFSGAIGYSNFIGPRFELETSHEKFDVRDPGDYLIKDTYRYFALASELDSSDPKNPKKDKFTVMRNDGISISSIIFNGCYDTHLRNLGISHYICFGIGGDFIEFFNASHIKLAYQGKLGINYPLSDRISLFINAYYHKTIGTQFHNLNVQNIGSTNQFVHAIATLNIAYFGSEIGARITFPS